MTDASGRTLSIGAAVVMCLWISTPSFGRAQTGNTPQTRPPSRPLPSLPPRPVEPAPPRVSPPVTPPPALRGPVPPAPDAVSLVHSRNGASGTAWWVDMTSLRRVGDRVTYWELSTAHTRNRGPNGTRFGAWTQHETDCRTQMTNLRATASIDGDVRYGPVVVQGSGMFSNGFRPIVYAEGLQVMRLVCDGIRPYPDERPLTSVGAALLMAGLVK